MKLKISLFHITHDFFQEKNQHKTLNFSNDTLWKIQIPQFILPSCIFKIHTDGKKSLRYQWLRSKRNTSYDLRNSIVQIPPKKLKFLVLFFEMRIQNGSIIAIFCLSFCYNAARPTPCTTHRRSKGLPRRCQNVNPAAVRYHVYATSFRGWKGVLFRPSIIYTGCHVSYRVRNAISLYSRCSDKRW